MGFKPVILSLSALLVVACTQGGRVEVSGTSNDLRFSVLTFDGRKPRCADRISVAPAMPDDAEPVWSATAVSAEKCAERFRFGAKTVDFVEDVRATALRPGIAYRVRASGAGFTAVRDFRVTQNGVTQQRAE